MLPTLSTLQIVALSNVAVFVLTLLFGQKLKDFVTGVPSDLRTALSAVEADTKAKLKSATADVLAHVVPPAPKAPAAPVAPVAPVTPAPVAPAAPAA